MATIDKDVYLGMYHAGMNDSRISKSLGVDYGDARLTRLILGLPPIRKHDVHDVHGVTQAQMAKAEALIAEAKRKAEEVSLRDGKIEEMYRSGVILEDIGKVFGITKERVRQILVQRGVSRSDGGYTIRARKRNTGIALKACGLIKDGKSLKAISDRFGLTYSVVYNAVNKSDCCDAIPSADINNNSQQRIFSEQDVIEAIRDCARDIGRTPSRKQYAMWRLEESPNRISGIRIIQLYGWSNAIKMAGLEPNKRSKPEHAYESQRGDIRRTLAEVAKLARLLGRAPTKNEWSEESARIGRPVIGPMSLSMRLKCNWRKCVRIALGYEQIPDHVKLPEKEEIHIDEVQQHGKVSSNAASNGSPEKGIDDAQAGHGDS